MKCKQKMPAPVEAFCKATMKLFIVILFLLLICGETSHEAFAQRKAVSAAEVTGTFRSYFKGKARRSYNEILIQAIGGNKLKVEMELIYPFEVNGEMSANVGTASGNAVITGDTAVFMPGDSAAGSEACKITLKFSKLGTLIVSTENNLNCGFGFNVSADGTYKKTSRAKPRFRSS